MKGEAMRFWILTLVALATVLLLGVAFSAEVEAASLTWKDNASNEEGYVIQRAPAPCDPVPTTFAEIARVGKNVTSYVDAAMTPNSGVRVCYRVAAFNYKFAGDTESAQYSGFSNLAGIDYPFPIPDAAPSQLLTTP